MGLKTAEILLATFLGSPSLPAAEPDRKDGARVFQTVCAACHGPRGQGNKDLHAPSIGGLPDWYVMIQLEKFRAGKRGSPPDYSGAAMRTIALALPEDLLPALASHVASLESHPTQGEAPENLDRVAEHYFETCAPCHRYNAHGERAFKSAPISLLPGWYVESALRKFRDGIRGGHPEDEEGGKMRDITAHLSNEMIQDLAAYLSVLAEKYPPGQRRPRDSSLSRQQPPPPEEPQQQASLP